MVTVLLVIGVVGVVGCGGSNPPLNTAPLTAEEQERIRQRDKKVEDEERGYVPGQKKPR
jgi:hypothetical protein